MQSYNMLSFVTRFSHMEECLQCSNLCSVYQCFYHMDIPKVVYPFMSKWTLENFHILATRNNCCFAQIFAQPCFHFSSVYMLRYKIGVSYGNCKSDLWKKHQIIFQPHQLCRGITILHIFTKMSYHFSFL